MISISAAELQRINNNVADLKAQIERLKDANGILLQNEQELEAENQRLQTKLSETEDMRDFWSRIANNTGRRVSAIKAENRQLRHDLRIVAGAPLYWTRLTQFKEGPERG